MNFSALLRPLANRIANLVARAVVKLADDSAGLQLLQVGALADETREGVERFQNYGFTSVPQAGAEAVVLFVGGRRDHGLAIVVDDRRYRLSGLESGEVALYTDQGDSIVIRRGGTIEISASTKVHVAAPAVDLGTSATQAVILGTAYRTAEATKNTALAAQLTAAGTALASMGADPVLLLAAPAAAGFAAAAGTALGSAAAPISTFEGGAAGYLSTVSRTQ